MTSSGAAFLPTDGQATPRTSPSPLPKARATRASRSSRNRGAGIEVEDGRVRAVAHRQGPHRLRQDRELRRPVVTRARAHGRRQHSSRLGAAPISDHRAIEGVDAGPADVARSRPAHLLEGGGRRPGDGRLRAKSAAVGAGRPSRPLRVPAARRRFGALRADPRTRRGRVPAMQTPASKSSSTGRRVSRRTAISSSAKRRRCAASMSAPASTPSASPQAAAPAWRSPSGSPRASRPTISGRSTFAASARTTSTPAGCAGARSKPTPSTTPWPGRSRNTLAGGRCAARRSTTD